MEWAEPEAVQLHEATDAQGGFVDLGVHPSLVKALAAQGITEPFPIQQATIADAIAGRDVLGRGRTGSGKTLAFGLSMLTRLANLRDAGDLPTGPGRKPAAMILVPTRELALQVADVLGPLAKTLGLFPTLVTGGMSYTPQQRAFARGVDIVVATPGRLIDLVEQGIADLSEIRIAVLDEADQMADMGFLPDMITLLDATPSGGQRMLFSATLDEAVDQLVAAYLTDPTIHEVDSATALVTTMTHRMFHVLPPQKMPVAAQIAARSGRTLAFVRTQMGADRTAAQLREQGIMAGALHGGMTQGARRRTLDAFRSGAIGVLVATDVAARGIDIDDVSLVLQIDPPRDPKDYTHRAGRTARAGESGVVVTLVLPHQRREMARLAQQAGVPNTIVRVAAGDDYLNEHVGEVDPTRDPITEEEYRALIAPQQPTRSPKSKRDRRPYGGHRGGGQKKVSEGGPKVRRHDYRDR